MISTNNTILVSNFEWYSSIKIQFELGKSTLLDLLYVDISHRKSEFNESANHDDYKLLMLLVILNITSYKNYIERHTC